jgi:MFS transporter, DHA3 family, tetracycline resistance protein
MRKFDPYKVYLFLSFASSLLFSMAFTVMSLYEATTAGLNPLQLVLVGTTLEISALVFEVPTGVVADAYSRRLSIIIGHVLMGVGFLVEGLFPMFVPILFAQVLWGLGYTFTSGATQAWISDEIGEARANKAFLVSNRLGLIGALTGMLIAVLVGSFTRTAVPILFSGAARVLLAFLLFFLMAEHGFKPARPENRNSWQHMGDILRQGLQTVRARPALLTILGVGLFYGLYSEGFDRLWVKHLLESFTLPVLFGNNQVAFFGFLRAGGMLASIAVTRFAEKRLDTSRPNEIGRAMLFITGAISVAIVSFALSPWLGLAIVVYICIAAMRNLVGPLYDAWVNQRLESRVRATIISMSSQVDAIGQIAGGPAIGLVAKTISVQLAMTISGLLLTPALPLIVRANRLHAEETPAQMHPAEGEIT